MLSETLLKRLNEQIALEAYSANLYLQMSSWCQHKGLNGCAGFLRAHSREEMGHMLRLVDYINETGSLAEIPEVSKPPAEWEGIPAIFNKTLEHEQSITAKINELVDAALTEKDFSTFHFLQWYVAEQHEEEALFKTVLDRIDLVGTEGRGLFMLDDTIGKLRPQQ